MSRSTFFRFRVTPEHIALAGILFFALFLRVTSAASQDFSRAGPGYAWGFPADHGAHRNYATEWWYYTGQLYSAAEVPFKDKPEYGFQLTFFRRGIKSSADIRSEFMAHAAITDVRAGKTFFASRVGGGALGVAGVSRSSLRAWSGDWSVDPIGEKLLLRFSVPDVVDRLARLQRILIDTVPEPWLQGIQGISAKGRCAGCASMYYSLPALPLSAQYVVGDAEKRLRGIGWMDHEFMTNSLSPNQVGWDWMGLMLKDGRTVMLFQVRDQTGKVDFASGGIKNGNTTRVLRHDEFALTPVKTWTSKATNAAYPIEWRVVIPSENIDTAIQARVNASEIGEGSQQGVEAGPNKMVYWEGPVASQDESVVGYLEMTGYAGKMAL